MALALLVLLNLPHLPTCFPIPSQYGQTDDHRGSGRLGQIQLTNLAIPRG
uniref:Uncharacterized protein n=1 Tax=Desertifilum tharense IPPAS B-1220 TaxID=1781255 RepID=A0ACD5GWQ1_9CYAN